MLLFTVKRIPHEMRLNDGRNPCCLAHYCDAQATVEIWATHQQWMRFYCPKHARQFYQSMQQAETAPPLYPESW